MSTTPPTPEPDSSDDVRTLQEMGYKQELARVLGGFSNFAISLSIICILAGGITSFHVWSVPLAVLTMRDPVGCK